MDELRQHIAVLSSHGATQALHQLVPPTQSSVSVRRLKLKEIIVQISEEECDSLSEMQLAACHARWEALMGTNDVPDRNKTPTGDQLSAVAHLTKHGVNPFVDMGVFG